MLHIGWHLSTGNPVLPVVSLEADVETPVLEATVDTALSADLQGLEADLTTVQLDAQIHEALTGDAYGN